MVYFKAALTEDWRYLPSDTDTDQLKRKVYNLLVEDAKKTGLDEYLNVIFSPIVSVTKNYETSQGAYYNVGFLGVNLNIAQNTITVDTDDFFTNELHNLRSLQDLLETLNSFNSFIVKTLNRFCTKVPDLGDFAVEKFMNHKLLDEHIKSIDPNHFFSFDENCDIYYYLPRYQTFVSTLSASSEAASFAQSFMRTIGDGYPQSIEESDYNHNKKPALRILTKKYTDSDMIDLVNRLEAGQLQIHFKEWDSKEYIEHPLTTYEAVGGFDIAEELTQSENVGIDDRHTILRRGLNDTYLFADKISRKIYKTKNIAEVYEDLYGISSKRSEE